MDRNVGEYFRFLWVDGWSGRMARKEGGAPDRMAVMGWVIRLFDGYAGCLLCI